VAGIDWVKTFEAWKTSECATAVTSNAEIFGVANLLKDFGENGRKYQIMNVSVTQPELDILHSKYRLGIWDLFMIASDQIREHKRLWHVHPDKLSAGFKTYETALAVSDIRELKYFKIQFKGSNEFFCNPKAVKSLCVSLHRNNFNIEVQYES